MTGATTTTRRPGIPASAERAIALDTGTAIGRGGHEYVSSDADRWTQRPVSSTPSARDSPRAAGPGVSDGPAEN